MYNILNECVYRKKRMRTLKILYGKKKIVQNYRNTYLDDRKKTTWKIFVNAFRQM